MDPMRNPLPSRFRSVRNDSFSMFVSNLPEQISKAELEAMFWRAGRTVDIFIPVEKETKINKGFAFVRFAMNREAESCKLQAAWIRGQL